MRSEKYSNRLDCQRNFEIFFALKFWRAKNGCQQALDCISSGGGLWNNRPYPAPNQDCVFSF
jgi:hypothetical protein